MKTSKTTHLTGMLMMTFCLHLRQSLIKIVIPLTTNDLLPSTLHKELPEFTSLNDSIK